MSALSGEAGRLLATVRRGGQGRVGFIGKSQAVAVVLYCLSQQALLFSHLPPDDSCTCAGHTSHRTACSPLVVPRMETPSLSFAPVSMHLATLFIFSVLLLVVEASILHDHHRARFSRTSLEVYVRAAEKRCPNRKSKSLVRPSPLFLCMLY